MNRQENIAFLRADLATIDGFLAAYGDRRPLGRLSWESRRQAVVQELATLEAPQREKAVVDLTFAGGPVLDEQRGIRASFASRALALFEESVAAVAAAIGSDTGVRRSGPIPNRLENTLFVTAVARGSFGFRLEERDPEPSTVMVPTPLAVATTATQVILEAAARGDEALADALSMVPERAVVKLHEFANYLSNQAAYCTISSQGRKVRINDDEQLAAICQRLEPSRISQEEREVIGVIGGAMPHFRQFEMTPDGGEPLRGTIGDEIADPDEVQRLEHQRVRARVRITAVGPGGAIKRCVLLAASPESAP